MRRKVLAALVVLSTLCLISTTSGLALADTALGTSKWSLEIGTNLGSGNTDYSFAVRRHSGASSAFRFGIQADVSDFDGDGTRSDTGVPDSDAAQSSSYSFQAYSIQWMRFAAIRDNVTGTFAIGPVYEMLHSAYRQGNNAGLPTFNEYEQSQKATTYGLDLNLGVEWFFNSRLSLGGQAGLRGTTGTSDTVSIQRSGTGATYQKDETDIEADVTRITTSNARIRLSAYF